MTWFIVLLRNGTAAGWGPDWDGVLHTDRNTAAREANDARSQGYEVELAQVTVAAEVTT